MDILQQRDKRLQDVRSQHTSFLIEDILFRPKTNIPQVSDMRLKKFLSGAYCVWRTIICCPINYDFIWDSSVAKLTRLRAGQCSNQIRF